MVCGVWGGCEVCNSKQSQVKTSAVQQQKALKNRLRFCDPSFERPQAVCSFTSSLAAWHLVAAAV